MSDNKKKGKKPEITGKEFLGMHKGLMDSQVFWDEMYRSTIYKSIEVHYARGILRDMYISDIVMREDKDGKVLLKWTPRIRPLTDEELKEQYGK